MFGLKQTRNALLPQGIPPFVQSLDDAIAQLVRQHGADAVRESVKRSTRKKIGRKQEMDFPLLADWFKQDALDWLDGKDPAALRSNYAMANHVADQAPKHYRASVHRRVMRKLAARRQKTFLFQAWSIAHEARPFGDYLRAGQAVMAIDPKFADMVQWMADNARGKVARYREAFGRIDESLTIPQIEEVLKPSPIPEINRTISGLLGTYRP